jgi:hypothetical protein
MSRTPRTFKQSDVYALVKAVEKAGKSVARVTLDNDGKITIFVNAPGEAPTSTNPWETRADEEISVRSKST